MQTNRINNLAGMIGNALEWCDYTLYLYYSSVFARIFFKTESHFLSLFLSLGVFAIGFLARPIGGLVLGYFSDRYSRRKVLIFSMSVMSVTTFLMAILPTQIHIGVWAAVLMLLIRLVQGFAVGSELNGSATFLIEHAPATKAGFAGSMAMSSAYFGILLGVGLGIVTELLRINSELIMLLWWRFPFLVCSVLGIVAILLRYFAKETPVFEQTTKVANPFTFMLRNYKREMLIAFLLTSGMAVCDYMFLGYFIAMNEQKFSLYDATLINFIALVTLIFILPIYAMLADRMGKIKLYRLALITTFVLSYPIFWLLSSLSWGVVLLAELLYVCVFAAISATILTILSDLFVVAVRNSGTSFGYTLGQAIFGGTAPLIALSLVELTHNKCAPAFYLMVCVLIPLVTLSYLKRR